MDFVKFVSMLKDGLYFSRLDCFADRWEFALPKGYINAHYIKKKSYFYQRLGQNWKQKLRRQVKRDIRTHSEVSIRCLYASCWYCSQHESDAMWRLYSSDHSAIAIKSTTRALFQTLQRTEHRVCLGSVAYCDYTLSDPYWSGLEEYGQWSAFAKRVNFSHEREFRAVLTYLGDGQRLGWSKKWSSSQPKGVVVPVDLRTLLDCVYVSPLAPAWFCSLVQDVLLRYGLGGVRVEQSELQALPIL